MDGLVAAESNTNMFGSFEKWVTSSIVTTASTFSNLQVFKVMSLSHRVDKWLVPHCTLVCAAMISMHLSTLFYSDFAVVVFVYCMHSL
jgi:hypothetical protein